MKKLPLRSEIINIITGLKSGEIERKSIAAWAFTIIDDDEIVVNDQIAWQVIQNLGAADLPTTDRVYLYDNEDFDYWIELLAS